MLNIKRITNFETDENCYLVYKNEKEGILIDPGNKKEVIIDALKKENIDVFHIFLTHCHYDHIECIEELRKELGAKVVSTFECNKNIQNPSVNLSSLFFGEIRAGASDILVRDNEILKISDMEIKTITTPGHTDGSACFLIDNELFSGDTLFLRTVGRWDFPTGNEKILMNSIKEKLFTLDDDVIVHPGHGNDTKIYYEKRYNVFVRG